MEQIANSEADRLGITGLVSAHRPANRDNVCVIQVLGRPSCELEFELTDDMTEKDFRTRVGEFLAKHGRVADVSNG
jgi:hypothetical protein